MDEKLNNNSYLKEERKYLRNNATSTEQLLWMNLKGKKLNGKKFRRQHSFGDYIMDFYCPTEKLAIEIDGHHHFTAEGKKSDKNRDQFLNDYGIRVLRFSNSEIENKILEVLEVIRRNLI